MMDTYVQPYTPLAVDTTASAVFENAQVVLADHVVDAKVVVEDGIITDIGNGSTPSLPVVDCGGDFLMPGLVELHTDALETHMQPRPGAHWPATAAVVSHDSQLAAAGITTVLDAIALGAVMDTSVRIERLMESIQSLAHARENGLLRADHLLHLRCEVTYEKLIEAFDGLIDHPLTRLVSLMDHTPGQRQFVDEKHYRIYYQGKFKLSDTEMVQFIEDRRRDQILYGEKHRRYIAETCKNRGISMASHDDATAEHVDESHGDGVTIAEFPTTIEAARASHERGIHVMMGGPNIVRAQSHSGNVSARELAEAGLLDIISSDYVPSSLLHAPFLLHELFNNISLADAVRMVTKNPAESAALSDRGEITRGRRGDLIRVHPSPYHPIVRGVWRQGVRVS